MIHKDHEGVSEARNAGIKNCRGDWIGFVDSDDWPDIDMYGVLMDRARESDSDVAMCGYYQFAAGVNTPVKIAMPVSETEAFEDHVKMLIKANGFFTSVWNKLFKREVIVRTAKTILMDPELSYGEDEVWLYEVLRECRRVCYVSDPLYHYRKTENSLSKKNNLSKEFMTLLKAKDRAVEMLPSTGETRSIFGKRYYYDLLRLKMIGYMSRDRRYNRTLKEHMKRYQADWFKSKEISTRRKFKDVLVNICMAIRMPRIIVKKIYDFHLHN